MAVGLIYHKNLQSKCIDDLSTSIFDMSHRGQEGYWFAVSDGKRLVPVSGSGIVDILNSYNMEGFSGVGQNSSRRGVGPALSYCPKYGNFALALDGYVRDGDVLRERYGGETDGELAARFIAGANDFSKGVKDFTEAVRGNFCLVVSTEKGETYGARCPFGMWSLVYGSGDHGSALVTGSRALSHIGMKIVRDVRPGEIVAVDGSGIHTLEQMGSNMHLCSFRYAYFAWIDEKIEGMDVDLVRHRIAQVHAVHDRDLDFDIVASVPDSGDAYAEHYAGERLRPYLKALIKYPYTGRSYDRETQEAIDRVARVKMVVVPRRAEDKRIVLTDDSIRRGSQLVKEDGPIALLKSANAQAIHLRVGSPRNTKFCRFRPPDKGDRYEDGQLAANRFRTDGELAGYLGIDSVRFPEVDEFTNCITNGGCLSKGNLCLGCYTGDFDFFGK